MRTAPHSRTPGVRGRGVGVGRGGLLGCGARGCPARAAGLQQRLQRPVDLLAACQQEFTALCRSWREQHPFCPLPGAAVQAMCIGPLWSPAPRCCPQAWRHSGRGRRDVHVSPARSAGSSSGCAQRQGGQLVVGRWSSFLRVGAADGRARGRGGGGGVSEQRRWLGQDRRSAVRPVAVAAPGLGVTGFDGTCPGGVTGALTHCLVGQLPCGVISEVLGARAAVAAGPARTGEQTMPPGAAPLRPPGRGPAGGVVPRPARSVERCWKVGRPNTVVSGGAHSIPSG